MGELLARERKKEQFGIDLSEIRQIDSITRDNDGVRKLKTRLLAKGTFRPRVWRNTVVLDRGPKLEDLPLSLDIHFEPTEHFIAIKEPIGVLQFWETSRAGGVNDPDGLTLAILLPDTFLARLIDSAKTVWMSIEVDGLQVVKEYADFPGYDEKVWPTKESPVLLVNEFGLADEVDREPESTDAVPESDSEPTVPKLLGEMNASLQSLTKFVEKQNRSWAIGAIVFAVLLLGAVTH
jgi:hypothetical protein